ncbi:hypothetical protein, partial [Lysobacter sp. 22409]|uniref:hypothetical protein n=1 Tax=Lysobacter sp. 22409 TaxID=3453917 RepID=UPI003F828600
MPPIEAMRRREPRLPDVQKNRCRCGDIDLLCFAALLCRFALPLCFVALLCGFALWLYRSSGDPEGGAQDVRRFSIGQGCPI